MAEENHNSSIPLNLTRHLAVVITEEDERKAKEVLFQTMNSRKMKPKDERPSKQSCLDIGCVDHIITEENHNSSIPLNLTHHLAVVITEEDERKAKEVLFQTMNSRKMKPKDERPSKQSCLDIGCVDHIITEENHNSSIPLNLTHHLAVVITEEDERKAKEVLFQTMNSRKMKPKDERPSKQSCLDIGSVDHIMAEENHNSSIPLNLTRHLAVVITEEDERKAKEVLFQTMNRRKRKAEDKMEDERPSKQSCLDIRCVDHIITEENHNSSIPLNLTCHLAVVITEEDERKAKEVLFQTMNSRKMKAEDERPSKQSCLDIGSVDHIMAEENHNSSIPPNLTHHLAVVITEEDERKAKEVLFQTMNRRKRKAEDTMENERPSKQSFLDIRCVDHIITEENHNRSIPLNLTHHLAVVITEEDERKAKEVLFQTMNSRKMKAEDEMPRKQNCLDIRCVDHIITEENHNRSIPLNLTHHLAVVITEEDERKAKEVLFQTMNSRKMKAEDEAPSKQSCIDIRCVDHIITEENHNSSIPLNLTHHLAVVITEEDERKAKEVLFQTMNSRKMKPKDERPSKQICIDIRCVDHIITEENHNSSIPLNLTHHLAVVITEEDERKAKEVLFQTMNSRKMKAEDETPSKQSCIDIRCVDHIMAEENHNSSIPLNLTRHLAVVITEEDKRKTKEVLFQTMNSRKMKAEDEMPRKQNCLDSSDREVGETEIFKARKRTSKHDSLAREIEEMDALADLLSKQRLSDEEECRPDVEVRVQVPLEIEVPLTLVTEGPKPLDEKSEFPMLTQRLSDEEGCRPDVEVCVQVPLEIEVPLTLVTEGPKPLDEKSEFPTLTEAMEADVNKALEEGIPHEVLSEGFGLSLTRKDLKTLSDLNWLNDEVINFYMNLLVERSKGPNLPTVNTFNTFFYPKLCSSGHAAMRRWTKNMDIFAKDILLVPVHLGVHWCLAVVDFRIKTIMCFDSMGDDNKETCHILLDYLQQESKDKKNKVLDASGWTLHSKSHNEIPQQMNDSDCGMFTCKYADYITKDKPISFTKKHMPYFRKRMVWELVNRKLM